MTFPGERGGQTVPCGPLIMCYANGGQRRAIAYHCENPASVALLLECSHDDYARKEG